ncbi:hypothetical protein Scep_016267 [Stephania cephalantha]|uniref:Uncharacterized protein n=1 Tax=Stephania cephalantha TaxID=152367 RepID=A0AAP0IMB0_9MAGN
MGGSFGEGIVLSFIEDVKGSGVSIGNGDERDHVFNPIDHPLEPPPHEDKPVKCPVPPDSSLLNDGGMRKERSSENLGKRVEQSSSMVIDEVLMEATEPPAQAVRKRHHTLTSDHTTPSVHWGPLPLPSQTSTIFQLLQQYDEFED